MDALAAAMRFVLAAAAAAMVLLTFGWPLVSGADTSHPLFRGAAIAAFAAFLASLPVLLACKARRT